MLALVSGDPESIQTMEVGRGLSVDFLSEIYTHDVEACSAEIPLLIVSEIMATQNSLERCLASFHSSQ